MTNYKKAFCHYDAIHFSLGHKQPFLITALLLLVAKYFFSALDEQDPKEVLHIEERYFATMQRSISCTTLAMGDFSSGELERKRNRSSGGCNYLYIIFYFKDFVNKPILITITV